MRTTFWVSMFSAALLSVAGCKKKDDPDSAMDRAGATAAKAQEDMNDQRKDIASEQKDVMEDRKDLSKEQADVAKQQHELSAAQGDFAQARERYSVAAKQRLADIDAKLQQLEMKADASAKGAAAKLRVQRDALATKLSAVGNEAQSNWDTFKKDVDDGFDRLESDVKDALD